MKQYILNKKINLKSAIIVLILTASYMVSFADDILMTRKGMEYTGKLDIIGNSDVVFNVRGGYSWGSRPNKVAIPIEDVYMIKTEKRGTIFFNRQRERSIQPTNKIEKDADVIYLVDGGEIPAWNVTLANGILSYQKNSQQKRAMSNIGAYPLEEIFMVKYNDGSRDIFTDITSAPPVIIPEKIEEKETEKKLKIIMYTVQTGETLGDIASKFNVNLENIIEWNELSPKSTKSTKPAAGNQLMIQVETLE